MHISKVIGRSLVAFTLAVAPLATVTLGVTDTAFAKGGNGNGGGGGGNGNGGNGNGGGHGGGGGNGNGGSQGSKGGSHGGGSFSPGKSQNTRSSKASAKTTASETPTLQSLFGRHSKKSKEEIKTEPTKTQKAAKASVKTAKSEVAGLSSLNRNYHAYLHSNDPRMAAISAYAMAYAEFEKVNGVDAIPADPALSDEALREALASFTKGGVVTDAALAKAKDILGVGPAVGKIDQIRDTLPEPEPVTEPTEPPTDGTSEPIADDTSGTTTETTTESSTTVTVTSETTTTVDPAN